MWGDNVVSVLRPIWTLSRFFGLCPRSIEDRINKRRKIDVAFSGVYVILALSVSIFLVYSTTDFSTVPYFNIVTQLADIIYNVSNNISLLTSVVFSSLHQNRLVKVLNQLQCTERKLKSICKWKPYTTIKLFIFCELLFTFFIWLSFFIYYVILDCKGSIIKCTKRWFIIYTSTKICQVVLIEFCAYAALLHHNLNLINYTINKLLTKQNQMGRDFFHKETLNEISQIYSDIMTCFSDVQSIFAIPLLMKILNQFISIFSSLYFCVYGYIYEDQFVMPATFNAIVIPFISVLIATVELLTIVTVCELLFFEYKTTGKLIYRIRITRNNSKLLKMVSGEILMVLCQTY